MASDDTGEPRASRPRMFGTYLEPAMLPWRWAADQLEAAYLYWIVTTRPGGRPHTRPVWGVWRDDRFYFSTGSLAARNLEQSSEITVHLESGADVVIVEGTAEATRDVETMRPHVEAYNAKYRQSIDPDEPMTWYVVRPRVVFGWIAEPLAADGGACFHGSVTKWTFG